MPRPARDVDLIGFGPAEETEVKAKFVAICGAAVEPDGLYFKSESVTVAPIREEASYAGLRVALEATLGNVRIPLQVDIGYGDAVTPAPAEIDFPPLLDFPAPRVRAYPTYTVVAEKLEAIVLLGLAISCGPKSLTKSARAGKPAPPSIGFDKHAEFGISAKALRA